MARQAGKQEICALLGLSMAATLAMPSCRSKFDVKTQVVKKKETQATPSRTPPEIKGRPELLDLGDLFQNQRTVLQSRSTLKFSIRGLSLKEDDDLTFMNMTSNVEIFAHEIPLPTPTELADGETMLQSVAASDVVEITLFPSGRVSRERRYLTYGDNEFKLFLNDEKTPRFTSVKLTIRDFPIFSAPALGFSEQKQISNGFQGELSLMSRPVVSNQAGTLTTGLVQIVNR